MSGDFAVLDGMVDCNSICAETDSARKLLDAETNSVFISPFAAETNSVGAVSLLASRVALGEPFGKRWRRYFWFPSWC